MTGIDQRKDTCRKILHPYFTAKKDQTQAGIYRRLRPGPDDRIRTVLSSTGTETSRLSSSESIIGDERSTNLQNLSNISALEDELYVVRDCLIADPGMVLLAVDYDKAEAICQAAYAQDWQYYDMLISGEDVHAWHAKKFFGRVGRLERQISKNATYASNYMASVKTIQTTVNKKWKQIGRRVTRKEIDQIHSIYLGLHPLEAWWRSVQEDLSRYKSTLRNAFGFQRTFYNPDGHKRLKEALAFLPQSTVASNINRSLIEIDRELDSPGELELLMQVHDELLFQVRSDVVGGAFRSIKDIMEKPFEVYGRSVFIPASGKVGSCWGRMQELPSQSTP